MPPSHLPCECRHPRSRSTAILVSFLWGTLGPSPIGNPVENLYLSLVAAVLLLVGVCGIVRSQELGQLGAHLLGFARTVEPLFGVEPLVVNSAIDVRRDATEAPPPVRESDGGTSPPQGLPLVGLAAAILVGMFGGSILVPLGFLGSDYDGVKALAFLPSFGLGSLLGSLLLGLAWHAYTSGAACASLGSLIPKLGTRSTLLAGIASGVVWNCGNVCQLIAQQVYGVPYGVAYPILQASLVVGGLLGIFVFGEFRQRPAIVAFFAASSIVVTGAILLGFYGPRPGSAPATPPTLPAAPPALPPADFDALVYSASPVAPPASPEGSADRFFALGKVLTNVIVIQLLGYILKTVGMVTPVTEAGIGHYVGAIAFPSVLFRALATIAAPDSGSLALIVAIGVSKATIFGLSFMYGVLTTPSSSPPGLATKRASLLAIYATQSDDIALGLPALTTLFPAYANSLYVLSALQALLFNPVAYVCLGVGEARAAATPECDGRPAGAEDAEADSTPQPSPPSIGSIALKVIIGLRSNTLVLSVLAGLSYRLALGPTLPWWLAAPVELLGRPFEPLVYLIGGTQ